MPTFEYRGRRGDQVMTGSSRRARRTRPAPSLRRQQIIVDQVKEKGREIALPFLAAECP
jgi:hypothetical protein